jgi:hypothetical protein
MKRVILLILCNSFYFVQGQNLVPNYSFENYITCVSHDDEFINYVADWSGQEGSGGLGYFTHQCTDTFPQYESAGVPNNLCGFQYAHTGISYTEMVTFVNGSITDTVFPYGYNALYNQRNYIEAKLIDSLKKGIIYYVTFYTSLADSSVYACSDIGAYFSDSALNLNGDSVKYYLTPQVSNNSKKQELSDKINWMKIAGSFVAKGGEKYIIIGNFKNDSASSIRYLGPSSSSFTAAYYYIDDVIVSPDSGYADSLLTVGVQNVSESKPEVSVFPNPSNGVFTIESSVVSGKSSVEIYNVLGQTIYQTQIKSSNTQIDLSNQPSGIYLYRVVSENGELVGSEKLLIE